MREDVFTCDVCEKSTSSPTVQKVWTKIELLVPYGMCRVATNIDLCPECQDNVFLYLKSMKAGATADKEVRKTFL